MNSMDIRPNPPATRPAAERRQQKYLHFALLPGDEALIEQLPAEQQAALRSEGSYAQRAQEQGIAIGTIRSRLHRARAALVRLRESQKQGEEAEPPQNDSGTMN
jgi:DNA-directed RNA polymerase specialized sigma24 family protein